MPNSTITTVLAARDALGEHDCANHAVMRLLVDRVAADRGLPPAAWPALPSPPDSTALDVARQQLAEVDVTGWDGTDLGAAYEHLLSQSGAWFTPLPVAEAMCRLAIGPQLDKFARHPDPGNVLQVLVVDPSCGAGVFLVCAARLVTGRYAERLFGEVTDLTVRIVMPQVMDECIFGIDLDPVCVDLAKAALWMEIGGEQPIAFMDRNVIVGDTLAGPEVQPPKLAERLAQRDNDQRQAS